MSEKRIEHKYHTLTIGDFGGYLLKLTKLLKEHPMSIRSVGSESSPKVKENTALDYAIRIVAPDKSLQDLDDVESDKVSQIAGNVLEQLNSGNNGDRRAIYVIGTNDEELARDGFKMLRAIEVEASVDLIE